MCGSLLCLPGRRPIVLCPAFLQTLHVDAQQRLDLEGIKAHPWFCAPLPPLLAAGWQRAQQAQRELDARLAGLRPSQDAVRARNRLVHRLVREAAAVPDQWEESLRRLAQARRDPDPPMAGWAACLEPETPPPHTNNTGVCPAPFSNAAAGQPGL